MAGSFDSFERNPVPTTQAQRDILTTELDKETFLYDKATDPEKQEIHGRNMQRIARGLLKKKVEGTEPGTPLPERRPLVYDPGEGRFTEAGRLKIQPKLGFE